MQQIPELTINWHVLESCNYDCYFCYAKYSQKSRFSLDFEKVLKALSALNGKKLDFQSGSAQVESIRVNFAGGEPFLAKGQVLLFRWLPISDCALRLLAMDP